MQSLDQAHEAKETKRTTKKTKGTSAWQTFEFGQATVFFGIFEKIEENLLLCISAINETGDYQLNSHSDSLSSFLLLIHFCSNVLWRPAF